MKKALNIYFGSGSGNAQRLSESFEGDMAQRGYLTTLTNLRDIHPGDLPLHVPSVFIVSTWGEGDPPPDAQPFCRDLAEGHYDLHQLHYAVVALGDSCFRNYCGCGVKLDASLARQGAQPFLPVEKLDVCYHPGFDAWFQRFLDTFPNLKAPGSGEGRLWNFSIAA